MVAFSARMFLAPTSAGVAVSAPTISLKYSGTSPGASGRFRRQKDRKRHQRTDAADRDPEGPHDCLLF